MSNATERHARALTLLIVWSVALGGLFAALLALTPAARAGTCDQVGGVITGDWTITNTQVCSGILYSVDGTINVNSGGSLTLTDGGLSFSKDTSHEGYALNVNAGGELILDNSIVTTQTDSIAPFLRLALTVSGANSRFTMKNGATLKLPGWFNATSATINVTDSKITGFTDSDLSGLGLNTDDNNDAPLMAWATTTVGVYRSRIERLYEYTGGTPGNLVLTASSNLYAYDSYIGVDYSNTVGVHNELRVDGASNAWNRTDANGLALIPLFTDQITTASLPNAESFGNYHQQVTYAASSTSGDEFYDPYPAVSAANNSKWVTMAFSSLQVCPTGVTAWSFNRQIVGSVSVSSCLEISGSISITDGGLYVDQGSAGNSRAYVKILSGGQLTLVNSTVWSNDPLAFYVSNGGTLVASRGSALTLTAQNSPGLLREEGPTSRVAISDSTIDANVTLFGGSAILVRDSFLGPDLWIDTVQTTHLWDASLPGVTNLAFLTDDGNANTVDLDIRNTTFNQVQTSQLIFGGAQSVQLTSVQTFDPNGSWWVGMITGGAQVSRYWWLHVNAVDGTGTSLAGANVHILVQRLDPNTLTPFTVPNPAVDDIYLANSTTWPVSAPSGSVVYRAFEETRTTSARVLNNSYLATGSAVVDVTTYQPDSPASLLLTADSVAQLTFSSLTPDLSITAMTVPGADRRPRLAPRRVRRGGSASVLGLGRRSDPRDERTEQHPPADLHPLYMAGPRDRLRGRPVCSRPGPQQRRPGARGGPQRGDEPGHGGDPRGLGRGAAGRRTGDVRHRPRRRHDLDGPVAADVHRSPSSDVQPANPDDHRHPQQGLRPGQQQCDVLCERAHAARPCAPSERLPRREDRDAESAVHDRRARVQRGPDRCAERIGRRVLRRPPSRPGRRPHDRDLPERLAQCQRHPPHRQPADHPQGRPRQPDQRRRSRAGSEQHRDGHAQCLAASGIHRDDVAERGPDARAGHLPRRLRIRPGSQHEQRNPKRGPHDRAASGRCRQGVEHDSHPGRRILHRHAHRALWSGGRVLRRRCHALVQHHRARDPVDHGEENPAVPQQPGPDPRRPVVALPGHPRRGGRHRGRRHRVLEGLRPRQDGRVRRVRRLHPGGRDDLPEVRRRVRAGHGEVLELPGLDPGRRETVPGVRRRVRDGRGRDGRL